MAKGVDPAFVTDFWHRLRAKLAELHRRSPLPNRLVAFFADYGAALLPQVQPWDLLFKPTQQHRPEWVSGPSGEARACHREHSPSAHALNQSLHRPLIQVRTRDRQKWLLALHILLG